MKYNTTDYIKTAFGVILFRILLDCTYYFCIAPVYEYAGFGISFTSLHYSLSWIFCLYSLLFIGGRLTKFSDYFFIMAVLSIIVPLTSLYGFDSARDITPVITSLVSFNLIYLIIQTKFISFKACPKVRNGPRLAAITSISFVFFLVVWYLISGVKLNINLENVYDFREANTKLSAIGLLAYTNSWTYQIFNTFLMSLSLFFQKYFLFLFFLVIQIYFFAASAHKGVLFFPLLVLSIWFYFRKTSSLAILPTLFNSLLIIILGTFFLLKNIFLASLFARRVFFVPANLTYVYFDFFNTHSHVFWSNSILKAFIHYPYTESLPLVIGDYIGFKGMAANNGFIATGYANSGFFGVFIYSLMIGLILKFINNITEKQTPVWLAVMICIVPVNNLLTSSDLFTTMLTHGFLISIILLFLTRTKTKEPI